MKSEPKSYLRFDYNLLLISVMAIFLRLFNIENQPLYCDEGMFMTISKFYVKQGLLVYTHWHHPPLKYFFFWSSSQLFSDNVIGYRMFSVVFGTLTVVVLYLLAKKVTGRLEIAFLASLFLAVDPFHITFSRVVIEEVAVGFFILLAVYLFLCFLEKPGPLCLWSAGISVGIAISLKWQALALIPALFAYYILHLTWRKKNKNPLTLFDVATFAIYFGLIPLSVYGLAYLPWFLKGHTLTEWLSIQRMMVQSISAVKGYMGTASTEQPLTWFVLPAYYILNYFQSPDGRFLLLCAFTNPATWLAVWPSVGRMWRKAGEEKKLALPLLVFAFVYLPFTFIALTGRPVYPYSATSLAALATFFAAYLFITLYEHPKSRPYVLALISLAFITSIILYPFAAGFPVSSDLYQPVTKFYSYFVVSK